MPCTLLRVLSLPSTVQRQRNTCKWKLLLDALSHREDYNAIKTQATLFPLLHSDVLSKWKTVFVSVCVTAAKRKWSKKYQRTAR